MSGLEGRSEHEDSSGDLASSCAVLVCMFDLVVQRSALIGSNQWRVHWSSARATIWPSLARREKNNLSYYHVGNSTRSHDLTTLFGTAAVNV